MIEIPYWWDGRLSSLRSTIHKSRPDLVSVISSDTPIPSLIDVGNKLLKRGKVYDLPPYNTNFPIWNGLQDITGWWISENVSGTRVYWDGKGRLVNRLTHTELLHLPENFTKDFPTSSFEGILR